MPEERKKATETQSEDTGNRPFPTPPRDPKKVRVFALVVGINDYKDGIPPLYGCLNDVEQVTSYLRSKFGASTNESKTETMAAVTETKNGAELTVDPAIRVETTGRLHLCTLDRKATYGNIVRAFREHLGRATEQDTVWFHFSGHGSEEFTAEEFLALEPNGKDQTLVCYRPPETEGRLHLADKELAVLLYEVATQNSQGRAEESPHIVVSLDCCHSGSGTRDFMEDPQLKTRSIKLNHAPSRIKARKEGIAFRTLDTYAGGYYARQWQQQQRLEVPLSKHVLLSACTSIQKAGDLPAGGIFTSSLIQALTDGRGQLNYADLFIRTRVRSRQLRREQTPQFETIGNFDPYTRFLDGAAHGNPERFEIVRQGDTWLVNCGAIHGLPVIADRPVELEIQTAAPENKPVARAEITAVGAQRSPFKIVEGGALDPHTSYQAVIHYLPALPAFVWLHGEGAGVQLLKDKWDRSKNVQWVEEADGAQLEVEATGGNYLLRDRRNGKLVWHRPISAHNATVIVENLGRMVKWERTLNLDNPKSSIRNHLSFELDIMDKDRQKTTYGAPEIRLYVHADNFLFHQQTQSLYSWFFPKVIIKDAGQELYGYLLHLRSNYSIEAPEGAVVFRPAEHPGKHEVEMPLLKSPRGWGISPDEAETTSYFQLLVTTEPIDYQQLLQSGIGTYRDFVEEWNPMAVKDDWCSQTIKVTLVRAEAQLSADSTTPLAGGNLRVRSHSGVRGRVAISTAPVDTYSADPASRLPLFQSPNLQLLDLRPNAEVPRQEVLELCDLKVKHPESLADEPLEIELASSLDPGELLLPIAFDGRDFRLVGDARPEGERTIVSLRSLPDIGTSLPNDLDLIPNPLDADDRQHRSLYETLKIGFFKLALSKADRRQLAWVHFEPNGNPRLQKEDLADQLEAADKVALLLPALIGEPADTEAYWHKVLTRERKMLQDNFDLVLIYDFLYPKGNMLTDKSAFPITNFGKLSITAFSEDSLDLKW